MNSPQNIRVLKDERVLELIWDEATTSRLPFAAVRRDCRCAVCVDEFSGKQLLDPATIPDDLGLVDISISGNYALRIRWSDQHDSGLFTWAHLAELASRMEQPVP
jgi:DUF971 family protein